MDLTLDTVDDVATGRSGLRKTILVLIGVAAIMGAGAANQLMLVSQRADKAEVRVSRLLSEQHTRYATGYSLSSLSLRIQAENLRLLDDIEVRRHGKPSDRWIAGAEGAVYKRLTPIVQELEDLPSAPALGPFLQRVISSDLDDNSAAAAATRRAMAEADSYSGDERSAAQSLFALAIGVALLAFSGIVAHRAAARLTLSVALGALLMCGFLMATNIVL